MPPFTLPTIPNACRYTAASQGIYGRGGLSRYGVNRRMNRRTLPCTSVNVRKWRTVQHGKRCVKRTPRCGQSAYSRTSALPRALLASTGAYFRNGGKGTWKRHRCMCSYSVVERCSCQSGPSKEGTRWDTSHKPLSLLRHSGCDVACDVAVNDAHRVL